MTKHILFLDAETFYDDDYSLRKMTPAQYILDPRYEEILWGAAIDNGPPQIIDALDFPRWLAQFDPAVTTTVTFNSLFDNCILSFRHGFVPARMMDAMGMARALRGHVLPGLSLDTILKVMQSPIQKGTAIHRMKGVHRANLLGDDLVFRDEFCRYCIDDVEGMRWLWRKLIGEFPLIERKIMHLVLHAAVAPRFRIDMPKLSDYIKQVGAEKTDLLAECGFDTSTPAGIAAAKSVLSSADKFIERLTEIGVEVEYKKSNTTGLMIPALAKTDEFMSDLLEDPDDRIANLAQARLGIKSTLAETRGLRLYAIGGLPWPAHVQGTLPIPLRYSGAHTHRLSGDWKINMQNLPRGSRLRDCLVVGPDEVVIVIDLAQIEARITAWLVGETGMLAEFDIDPVTGKPGDPYAALASVVFGYIVTKATHPFERFVGKGGVLGLGFGCGKDKFYNMVIRNARTERMDMVAVMAAWTPELAEHTTLTYRKKNFNTVNAWRALQNIIETAWCGVTGPVMFGPGAGCVEIGDGYVALPTRLKMRYKPFKKDNEWFYRYGKRVHKMYGAKFLENIVQALARCVLMTAAVRIADHNENWTCFTSQAHDELVYVVPKKDVDEAKRIIYEQVTRRPDWAPDLPLSAEMDTGASYGDAK